MSVRAASEPTNLMLLEELEDSSRTSKLADSDLSALRTVADWIKTFVVRPHQDLGRAGPVCPFVPRALQLKTLWLASERIENHTAADVVRVVNGYRQLLLRAQPIEGDDASCKAIVVVLSDASPDRLGDLLGDVRIQQLKRQSYAEDGVVLGEFHARNDGSAVRNPGFQPFKAPVPFLLLRPAVVGDWVFFLDNEDWFGLWVRRFGESATHALAEKLRRTNWRSAP
jgi:hypothetical protein